MTDIILIPGLWLDGTCWDQVVPLLEKAGHRPHPITLPGMESRDADRSAVTLEDQLRAVVAVIDGIDPADGQVILVGHSAASALAYAAADARPDRIERLFYIGGFPSPDGAPLVSGFEGENGEIALLDWSEFDDSDLAELDEAALAEFRARAIPSPLCMSTDPLRLSDERRYEIPATIICPEFTSEQVRQWFAEDEKNLRELAKARDLTLVDLPTSHWPQFTRPAELAAILTG